MAIRKRYVAGLLAVVVSLWAVPSLLELKGIQDVRFSLSMPSIASPLLEELWKVPPLCLCFLVSQLVVRKILGPVGRRLIPMKKGGWTAELWGAKIDRFSSAVFKFLFYVIFSGTLYRKLKLLSWLPRILGGSSASPPGNLEILDFSALPHFQVLLGFLLSEVTLHLLFERQKPDFWEIFLHHFLAIFLLFGAVFSGKSQLGAVGIFCHVLPDIFVFLAKSLVDTFLWTRVQMFIYFPLLLSHLYFRLFAFTSVVIRPSFHEKAFFEGYEGGIPAWEFLIFSLFLLLFLHVYWSLVIIKIGFFLVFTGQARDLQADLSALTLEEEQREGRGEGKGKGKGEKREGRKQR